MKKNKNTAISINKSVVRSITLKVPASIICNVCGEKVPSDSFGYMDNYISLNKKWGYGTKFDGELHSIDICAVCYEKFLNSLKIPARTE